MKKIDTISDHKLLVTILYMQLLTFEYVVSTCSPYAEKKKETLDYLAQYRKEMFEDEIHVD